MKDWRKLNVTAGIKNTSVMNTTTVIHLLKNKTKNQTANPNKLNLGIVFRGLRFPTIRVKKGISKVLWSIGCRVPKQPLAAFETSFYSKYTHVNTKVWKR